MWYHQVTAYTIVHFNCIASPYRKYKIYTVYSKYNIRRGFILLDEVDLWEKLYFFVNIELTYEFQMQNLGSK